MSASTDSLYHRREFLSQTTSASDSEGGRLYPHHVSPRERRVAHCGGRNPRRRHCLFVSRGPAHSIGNTSPTATRLRTSRQAGRSPGSSSMAGPALGLGLFLQRRRTFQYLAPCSIPCERGVPRPSPSKERRYCHGSRGITETRRVLFQPPAIAQSPSGRDGI